MTNSDFPILDGSILDEVRALQHADDDDVVRELIEIFFKDSLILVEGIREYISRRDLREIARAVHRLNGLAGSLGAVRLSKLCFKIEVSLLQAGDLVELNRQLVELEIVYQETCSAFLDHLNGKW